MTYLCWTANHGRYIVGRVAPSMPEFRKSLEVHHTPDNCVPDLGQVDLSNRLSDWMEQPFYNANPHQNRNLLPCKELVQQSALKTSASRTAR